MRTMMNIPESGPELLEQVLNNRKWQQRSGQTKMVKENDHEIFCSPYSESSIINSAGTGTGKSLAYLVATLPMQKKIVISTATKSLQNQLRNNEMPLLTKDLKELYGVTDFPWAVIKGMDNYPCIHEAKKQLNKVRKEVNDGALVEINPNNVMNNIKALTNVEIIELLEKIVDKIELAITNKDFGNLDCEDEIAKLPKNIKTKLSPKKCNTFLKAKAADDFDPENVLESGLHQACTYNYAYAYAMKADIIIMNTSLMAAEVNKISYLSRKEDQENGTPVLPSLIAGVEIVIVDEAHHAPDIIASSLSQSFSLQQFTTYVDEKLDDLERQNTGFKSSCASITADLSALSQKIENLDEIQNIQENQRKDLSQIVGEYIEVVKVLYKTIMAEKATMNDKAPFKLIADEMCEEIYTSLNETLTPLKESFLSAVNNDYAYDVTVTENENKTFKMINTVPLDLTAFGKQLVSIMKMGNPHTEQYKRDEGIEEEEPFARVILCSATITKNISTTLGLPHSKFVEVESPFDHSQTRIYIPNSDDLPGIPKYGDPDFDKKMKKRTAAITKISQQLVQASEGRTLALTTTKNAVFDFYYAIKDVGKLKVMHQYDENTREENMETFLKEEESVFVGTKGYWEGVDIPGKSLINVLIDRVSFPTPKDPVYAARSKAVKRRGGNDFMEVQVNYASNMITQAFGRLPRKVGDKGLVTVFDDKLITPRYASKLISLLPDDVLYTRDINVAKSWLEECKKADADETLPVSSDWKKLKNDAGKNSGGFYKSSVKPPRAQRVASKITYHN